jgi:hypothetical protein
MNMLEGPISIIKGTLVVYFVSLISNSITIIVLQLTRVSLSFSHSELILKLNP